MTDRTKDTATKIENSNPPSQPPNRPKGFSLRDPRLVLAASALATSTALAVTDGAFLERMITWRDHVFVDKTGLRIGWVIASGAVGFGVGWFFSREHKRLRAMLAGAVFGLVGFLLIADHGSLGWGSSTLLSIAAFAVGLGVWLRGVVSKFREPPTTFGSAMWASFADLMRYGMITLEGFRIGVVRDGDGEHRPLSYAGERHMLTIAPTTWGKGTCSIIPNLLTYPGSMLVIDPKGENAMETVPQRKKLGQEVYVVDPWGITGLESATINPLEWLKSGDVDIAENSLLISDAIIMMESKNEPFFDHSAKAALDGIILYVATAKEEEGQRHLGRVRDLLMLDGDDFPKLCKRMLQSPHHKVRSTGASLLQKDEKLLSNILASVQAQTNFLDSPRLRESLSRSDFSFADMKTKPMTVYLVLPADRLNGYERWLRLLIQQALTMNARNIETKPEKPVLFVLDELPALGKLSMVEQAFGLMAGFGMQLHGICQDLSQLKRICGDGWETFISNAGVIQYFGSRDNFTAEYFSKLCGVTTVWDISTGFSRAIGTSRGASTTTSQTTTTSDTTSGKQRRLAYADELMRMPETTQLVLVENRNPILAEKLPWFDNPEQKHLGVNLHKARKEAKALMDANTIKQAAE